MDEALEAVELVADSGFEDVFAWVLRVLGILCVLAGLGLWLATEMAFVPIPAVVVVVGLLLLVAPQILLFVAELAG